MAPADVTRRYRETMNDIISILRTHADLCHVERIAPLILLRAQGFRVLGEPVSSASVVKFMTFVGIGTSVYMTMVKE